MDLRRIVIAAALGVVCVYSSTASAQDETLPTTTSTFTPTQGGEAEREYLRPNRGFLFGGAAVLAMSYVPAIVVAATSTHEGDENLYIPVIGPWLDLAQRGGCGPGTPNSCSQENVYKGILIGAGVAQLVGTGLLIASAVVPEETTRKRASASTKPVVLPAQMGRDGAGVSVSGAF